MRKQYKEYIENRILDAALWCRLRNDGRDFQMTQVAVRAGISTRTLNRYFPDREGLLSQTAARVLMQKCAEFTTNYDNMDKSSKSGLEQLLLFLRLLRDNLNDDPAYLRMLADANFKFLSGEVSKEFWRSSFGGKIREIISSCLEAGVTDGSIRSGLDQKTATLAVAATCNGIMQEMIRGYCSELPDDEQGRAQGVFDSYIDMLALYLGRR